MLNWPTPQSRFSRAKEIHIHILTKNTGYFSSTLSKYTEQETKQKVLMAATLRAALISTMVIWTSKNEIRQTFSDEWYR